MRVIVPDLISTCTRNTCSLISVSNQQNAINIVASGNDRQHPYATHTDSTAPKTTPFFFVCLLFVRCDINQCVKHMCSASHARRQRVHTRFVFSCKCCWRLGSSARAEWLSINVCSRYTMSLPPYSRTSATKTEFIKLAISKVRASEDSLVA